MKRLITLFLLTVALCCAQPAIPQHKLNSLVLKWQKVLLLQDWAVSVVAVKFSDLPQNTLGYSDYDDAHRTLFIAVLQPSEYKQASQVSGLPEKVGKEIYADIEDTILHELVHLRLRAFKTATDSGMKSAEEVVVVRLTAALLHKPSPQ